MSGRYWCEAAITDAIAIVGTLDGSREGDLLAVRRQAVGPNKLQRLSDAVCSIRGLIGDAHPELLWVSLDGADGVYRYGYEPGDARDL